MTGELEFDPRSALAPSGRADRHLTNHAPNGIPLRVIQRRLLDSSFFKQHRSSRLTVWTRARPSDRGRASGIDCENETSLTTIFPLLPFKEVHAGGRPLGTQLRDVEKPNVEALRSFVGNRLALDKKMGESKVLQLIDLIAQLDVIGCHKKVGGFFSRQNSVSFLTSLSSCWASAGSSLRRSSNLVGEIRPAALLTSSTITR